GDRFRPVDDGWRASAGGSFTSHVFFVSKNSLSHKNKGAPRGRKIDKEPSGGTGSNERHRKEGCCCVCADRVALDVSSAAVEFGARPVRCGHRYRRGGVILYDTGRS